MNKKTRTYSVGKNEKIIGYTDEDEPYFLEKEEIKEYKRRRHILKLDKLWSELVKIRANNRCERCGKTTYLQSHHHFSRSILRLRFDVDNGFCLCAGCHTMSSNFSAHLTPALFCEWASEKRGEDWLLSLIERHNTIGQKIDLFLIEDNLKEMKKKFSQEHTEK